MDRSRRKPVIYTTWLMVALNSSCPFFIHWHRTKVPYIVGFLLGVMMLIGYWVLWYFYRGRNWARILCMLDSALCVYCLKYIPSYLHDSWRVARIASAVICAALGVYLLYWLNTREARNFFRPPKLEPSLPEPVV